MNYLILFIVVAVLVGLCGGEIAAKQSNSIQNFILGWVGIVVVFIGIILAYLGFTERI